MRQDDPFSRRGLAGAIGLRGEQHHYSRVREILSVAAFVAWLTHIQQ